MKLASLLQLVDKLQQAGKTANLLQVCGVFCCVVNLQGRIEPGQFSCNDTISLFQNCCFSNDNSKMATTYEGDLTVWNLANNAELTSFSSYSGILSVLFSANGRFLATSDPYGSVLVYDFERDDISRSRLDNINL